MTSRPSAASMASRTFLAFNGVTWATAPFVAACQTRTDPPLLAVTTRSPSGLKPASLAVLRWPRRRPISFPSRARRRRAVALPVSHHDLIATRTEGHARDVLQLPDRAASVAVPDSSRSKSSVATKRPSGLKEAPSTSACDRVGPSTASCFQLPVDHTRVVPRAPAVRSEPPSLLKATQTTGPAGSRKLAHELATGNAPDPRRPILARGRDELAVGA